MAGIDSYVALVVSIMNAPQYLPWLLRLVVRGPHRWCRWWRSTDFGIGIELIITWRASPSGLDTFLMIEWRIRSILIRIISISNQLKLGAISSGEDDLPGFLFGWISRAHVTVDPTRQAVYLRLA
jgi:hypothetical protein